MSLKNAHEGYEYQDLLSSYYILKEIINGIDCKFLIDRKEGEYDKFDDLTIISEQKIIKNQIKYSNEKVNYTLKKSDLSSAGGHELPIDLLFKAWKKYSKTTTKEFELRLELSWNEPEGELKKCLNLFEEKAKKSFENTKLYKINIDALWPLGEEPIKSWQRFKKESKNIDRSLFKEFCKNLIIEVKLPKASLDVYSPGALEIKIIELMKKIGIGKYPNNHIEVEEAIIKLLHKIKQLRAKEGSFQTKDLIPYFSLKTNYGSIHQNFEIDPQINVIDDKLYENYIKKISKNNKTVIFGEPGAGKSWFIQNLLNALNSNGINTIKHYCYVGMEDENAVDRIKTDIFCGNLIYDLIENFPELKKIKKTVYGSDFEELQFLIKNVKEDVVLIIDGLDHIDRVFKLKGNAVMKDEIEIINDIIKLDFPKNVKVIIATQPLERKKLEENGFYIENLPACNHSYIVEILKNNNLNNTILDNNKVLSEIILAKSNGNALYISYLIKEIKNLGIICELNIENLPPYSYNLSKYYDYLMIKLEYRNDIACTLCGVSFPLNKKELNEITEVGEFLDNDLKTLEPILKENYSNGGIVIYHESFRRYIIDYLKEKKLNIKKKIYKDIIEWFEKRDFFRNIKTYRYFFSVLFDAEEYSKIIKYLNKEFIVDSLAYGHSKNLINKNYKFFLKATIELEDFKSLIILSEINRILASTEDEFENIQELYLKTLGDVSGYEYLKELLTCSDDFSNEIELKICYMCSYNNVIPNWDVYLNKYKSNSIELENYKCFIRSYLDSNKIQKLENEIKEVSNDEFLEFAIVLKEEYSNYYGRQVCKEKFIEINEAFWDKQFNPISIKKKVEYQNINKSILMIEKINEEEFEVITQFFLEIDYFIDTNIHLVNEFIIELSDRNWFYNWLIFCINIKCLKKNNDISNQEKLIEVYSWLIKSLDPFLGEPRTVDLYYLQPFIYKSILKPLKYINTKESWSIVLNILKKLSIEITTSIQGSITGPLNTSDYLKLLEEVSNKDNVEIIIKLFKEIIKDEKEYRFYEYSTKNKLRLASLYSKTGNKNEATKVFKEALVLHTAYTFRKDMTFSELLDSIYSVDKINSDLGNLYIKKLKNLSDTVVNHTDGKETKHYPKAWYEEFLKINLKESILYLKTELLKCNIHWILENSLIKLLSKTHTNPIINSFIFKTFPTNTEKEFLIGYMGNIKDLFLCDKQFASLSFHDFINRFDFNQELNFNQEINDFILDMSNKLNIDKTVIKYKNKHFNYAKKWYEKLNEEIIERKNFGEMSLNEIIKYFNSNIINEKEINSLIYYFEQFDTLTEKLKLFIDTIVSSKLFSLDYRKHEENLKIIFENMKTTKEISSYSNTTLFSSKNDGWYKKFVDIDLFKDAYTEDKDVTKTTFFKHIYRILKEPIYHRGISSNIINALVEVGYNKEEIQKIWEQLFDIINYRLPGQPNYEWDKSLKNDLEMNHDELLICILLTRMKSGEVERQKWVLSGINYLLSNNNLLLIKPLKWFLKNKDNFLEISFLLILQVLWEYCFEKNYKYKDNFLEELKYIYPTENFMINQMLEGLLEIYDKTIIPLNINKIKYYNIMELRLEMLQNCIMKKFQN